MTIIVKGFDRQYYLTDHLGSIRTTVDGSGMNTGSVSSWDDYYTYGLKMPDRSFNYSNPQALNKFTGHEHDTQNDINLTYAGARYLDPEIGQWLSVDPLAAKFPEWSPYNYTMGNPMNLIDPDGRAPEQFLVDRSTGKIRKIGNKGGDKVDYYSIGRHRAGGLIFTVSREVAIKRESEFQLNAFRIEQGIDNGGHPGADSDHKSQGYTISTFHNPSDSEMSGFGVEPGGPATEVANEDKRIPEGRHNLTLTESGKFKILISSETVPAARAIKAHSGNYGCETAGCFMPNANRNGTNSGDLTRRINESFENGGGNGIINIVEDPHMITKDQ